MQNGTCLGALVLDVVVETLGATILATSAWGDIKGTLLNNLNIFLLHFRVGGCRVPVLVVHLGDATICCRGGVNHADVESIKVVHGYPLSNQRYAGVVPRIVRRFACSYARSCAQFLLGFALTLKWKRHSMFFCQESDIIFLMALCLQANRIFKKVIHLLGVDFL